MFLLRFGAQEDLIDSSKYAIYSGGGDFGIDKARDVFSSADDAPRRMAYRTYITGLMTVAGHSTEDAARIAKLVLEIETARDAALLTDAEKRDTPGSTTR